MTEYPLYFNLNKTFAFGGKPDDRLTNYQFANDGIQFQFGPVKSNDSVSYAGSTSPLTVSIYTSVSNSKLAPSIQT